MKRPTQRDRIRSHLIEHGSITNVEAMHAGIFRLSERIRELQEEGLSIVGDWVREDGKKTGTFRYALLEKPAAPRKRVLDFVMRDGERVCVERFV